MLEFGISPLSPPTPTLYAPAHMTPNANVSVVAPINPAIEHTRNVLFRPFDLTKWFVIGFCAWLATLGRGGSRSFGNSFGNHYDHTTTFSDQIQHARAYVLENLTWIIPVAIGLVVIGFALWVVFAWLNSRGRFMFLYCVALNRAEISEPWTKYSRVGNSLFKFQIIIGLIGMVLTLPLLAWAVVLIIAMIGHGAPAIGAIFLVSSILLAFLIFAIILSIVVMFLEDFVVPIMYLRDGTCLESWRELRRLMSGNLDLFVLYVLFQIVMAIALGLIVIAGIIVTCCLAGCLLVLPYLGTVVLLPLLVFRRSYSAIYLAQFGPEYNVFPPAPTPPPPPPFQPSVPIQPLA